MEKTITALKAQKNHPDRLNLYLDGEFAFGISRIVAAWLSVGQKITDQKIEDLLQQDTIEKGYQRALKTLQFRSRTEAEIANKLRSAEFHENVITQVIFRLKANHLIGDENFAQNWVENRSTFRPRSHRMMEMELRQKGIEEQVIDQAMQDAPAEEELAYKLGEKYRHRLKAEDWLSFRKKMGAYLLRRGFNYGIINDVLSQLWSNHQAQSSFPTNFENEEREKNND